MSAELRRFRPGVAMTLCVLPLLAVLFGLGVWQLSRAGEKARLEAAQLDRLGALPVAPPTRPDDVEFLRVRIRGEFERDRYFLVDNQVVNGRAGYWVVQSFLATDGKRWLLNRGWVDGGARRGMLPEVGQPESIVEVTGVCWPELGLLPMFGDEIWDDGWPKRVPRMNVARKAAAMDAQAVEIRLEPGQPGRLGALPMSLAVAAPRHRGYAVQWFGLALILVAGYVLYGYRAAAEGGSG